MRYLKLISPYKLRLSLAYPDQTTFYNFILVRGYLYSHHLPGYDNLGVIIHIVLKGSGSLIGTTYFPHVGRVNFMVPV